MANLRRKVIILVSLLAALICGSVVIFKINISGVSSQNSLQPTSPQVAATGDVKHMSLEGDIAESFSSLDELKQRASAIIEVNVIKSETIVYADMPFTISTATILSEVKGNFKEGQEIKLIETGGKYKLTGENPKEAKGQEVEVCFGGIPVMQPGDHLFLFVDKFVGPQVTGAYIPLGVYQGKFKVENDGKLYQQTPDNESLKDYKPVNKDVFKSELKINKNK